MSEGEATVAAKKKQRNFRTKKAQEEEAQGTGPDAAEEAEGMSEVQREKLEKMMLLRKLGKKMGGTSADVLGQAELEAQDLGPSSAEQDGADTELMGGFSKAKAVATTDEDPHMAKFVEAELARRLGKRAGSEETENPEVKRKRQELEMYQIPDQYKTNLVGDTVIPGMTTIISEVGLSADVRLKNIEQVENMKKRMLGGGDEGARQGQGSKHKPHITSFGKQTKRFLEKEQLEAQFRRMKHVTEAKPAVPQHRLKD